MERRDALKWFATASTVIVASTALAGCSREPNDGSTATTSPTSTVSPSPTATPGLPFETPAPDQCETDQPPMPTPTAGLQPKEYPEYPDTLSVSAVEYFSSSYEEAFQYNRYLSTEAEPETLSITVNAASTEHLTEEIGDGFVVAVEGYLSTLTGGTPTERTAVVTDNRIAGVYYLTAEYAVRGEISKRYYEILSLRPTRVTSERTIYCEQGS